MSKCEHRNVVVAGSDETGCQSIQCGNCGVPLRRVREDGEYVYVERVEEIRTGDSVEIVGGKDAGIRGVVVGMNGNHQGIEFVTVQQQPSRFRSCYHVRREHVRPI